MGEVRIRMRTGNRVMRLRWVLEEGLGEGRSGVEMGTEIRLRVSVEVMRAEGMLKGEREREGRGRNRMRMSEREVGMAGKGESMVREWGMDDE
jgi:hypothetical protein